MSQEGRVDLEALLHVVADELRHSVRNRPVATLAAAAGAGYVLGAGIPTFVLRAGGAMALRAVTTRVLSDVMQSNRRHEPEAQTVDGGAPEDPAGRASG